MMQGEEGLSKRAITRARKRARKKAAEQCLQEEAGSVVQSEDANTLAAAQVGAVVLRLPNRPCTVLFQFARDAWVRGRGKLGPAPEFVCRLRGVWCRRPHSVRRQAEPNRRRHRRLGVGGSKAEQIQVPWLF
jgi:hypothetical protein